MEQFFDQILVSTIIQIENFSHKMNPTIYLSCLVVIIGSLAWTASAYGDQEFQSELTRLRNIYGNDAVHRLTKYRNVPELMNFYEKYSNRFQLTPQEQQEADNAVRKYKEANQLNGEYLPPQGGIFSILFSLVINVLGPVIAKAIKPDN